jgi:hypothetical protein
MYSTPRRTTSAKEIKPSSAPRSGHERRPYRREKLVPQTGEAVGELPAEIDFRTVEAAALLVFQEEVRLLEPLTPALDRVRRALQAVTARGSTALLDATYAGLRLLEPGPRRTVVDRLASRTCQVSQHTDCSRVAGACCS